MALQRRTFTPEEYLLVGQNAPGFELFHRTPEGWVQSSSTDEISLSSVDLALSVASVYEGISFI